MEGPNGKVTLKDILMGYGQPVSEEQAWALCYQCCRELRLGERGVRRVPSGVEDVLLHQDGAVSFAVYSGKEYQGGKSGSEDSVCSEREMIERLGHIVYTALDWGVTSDLERVLSEPLDNLLCLMLGLQPSATEPAMNSQGAVTLNDTIKVCEERLFSLSEASDHYRAICRVQFAEHQEFCKLLRTLERSKQSLKQLEAEDFLAKDSLPLYESWNDLWRHVIRELRLGIRLSSAKERSYTGLPVVYKPSPHELLMNDIRCRRYTLRAVQENEKNKINQSPENFITDLIRVRPLKPASERKLKERRLEEPSLHELLMTEIKSATKLRPLPSYRNMRFDEDEDFGTSRSSCCGQSSDSGFGHRMWRRRRSCSHSSDLLDTASDEKISWPSEFSSETSSDSKFSDLPSVSTDLMFAPVLTSSQVDLKLNSFLSHDKRTSTHKRSSSYEDSFQRMRCGGQPPKSCQYPWIHPPTMEELVLARRETVKAEILDFLESNRFLGNKVCFSCHKKRLFFTWPYTCKMCERVNCLECSVEMLMPFKQCMHLPVSFFKALVLTREDDPVYQKDSTQMFYKETLNWDSSRIPLVFEPHAEDVPFHKSSMKNWTCMDVCTKCEEYILDVMDRSQQIEVPRDGLKMRSASVS
ncbi:protein spire homolog 1-like [Spea bombifrons]|uniref:protein spire homolog 1-like n=1 Tax=Spea bombifrons TaxID=233779 RepID=UPI0023493567|nr:protein spire homolog 1-like [Spea bombifrons]